LTVWQLGYADPPAHGLQKHRVLPSYQQLKDVSEQLLPLAGGGVGHPAGRSGVHRAAEIDQAPFWQRAVVLQLGRGSSPQLQ
jgi:hypothetical protein